MKNPRINDAHPTLSSIINGGGALPSDAKHSGHKADHSPPTLCQD